MHPHCPQGYEDYNGCPIVYSTGNFFFPHAPFSQYKSWSYGYMTMLDISKDKFDISLIPYKFDFDGIELLDGKELDNYSAKRISGMKNVFSCEAHNELVKNTFKVIYDGRFEGAKKGLKRLRSFKIWTFNVRIFIVLAKSSQAFFLRIMGVYHI